MGPFVLDTDHVTLSNAAIEKSSNTSFRFRKK